MEKLSLFLILAFLTAIMGLLPEDAGVVMKSQDFSWMEPQTIYLSVN